MDNNYVEPRLRRDFGGILNAYFEFVRQNYKGILNGFIAYNGIFMILILLFGYFFITNMIEYAVAQSNWVGGDSPSETGALLAGFSVIFLFIVLGLASVLNFSIASAYVSVYERDKQNNINRKTVWRKLKPKLWGMVVYFIATIPLFFVYFISSLILAWIPILGFLVTILIALSIYTWLGLSIFSYVNGGLTVFEAFGTAWKLMFSSFWKSIGINLIVLVIFFFIRVALNLIPGILIGIYIYNSVQESNFLDSTFAHILIVIMIALYSITLLFIQLFSQTVNGFLYFNLHEVNNNTYLRSRIEKLGEAV